MLQLLIPQKRAYRIGENSSFVNKARAMVTVYCRSFPPYMIFLDNLSFAESIRYGIILFKLGDAKN